MIDYKTAQKLIFENCEILGSKNVPIDKAIGRIAAGEIIAGINIFPYRNSAMDGYAVRHSDLASATESKPVTLPIEAVIYAGDDASSISGGTNAVKIMTGGQVPDGYDAVVMVEETSTDGSTVTFTRPVKQGANIRDAGEDIREGETVFRAGYRFRPLDIGILAGLGLKEVAVFQKPALSLITTGDELVEPGGRLLPGKIYNSNRYTISALVGHHCESLGILPTVTDGLEGFCRALECDSDVIITTGAVSAGDKDLLVPAAEKTGWRRIFHKVAIKPGKPIFFAVKGRRLLFGLPGNPLSAAVTAAFFVIPALRKLSGESDFIPGLHPAVLDPASDRPHDRTLIWPGKFRSNGNGLIAAFSEKTSSGALSALMDSDGLIVKEVSGRMVDGRAAVEILKWEQLA
ncbi:MAG: molybdopterin molybdotransferase MoeA [bacterium]|jgi:molybdopterin molybdotransferase